jgi:transposase
MIFSQQAYERECHSFEAKIQVEENLAQKELKDLCAEKFICEQDALQAIEKLGKKWKYHQAQVQVHAILKYPKPGKPKVSDVKTICWYQVQGCIQKHNEAVEASKKTLGRFILATNDLDTQRLQDEGMLSTYKTQSGVERGYAFIKDKTL